MKTVTNRLWFQMSLMIAGVLFFMFFLQFLTITLSPVEPGIPPANAAEHEGPGMETRAEIARRLVNFALLSVMVGFGGGILISWVITRPVSELSKAAQKIGKGDLSVRVQARGSQEIRDLANTFNRMAADLQHAEDLRNNLMADVSHELRTPLTVLEGNLRAALDHVYRLDEAEVANLYGQTRHLIRLVNDLHELALADANMLRMEKQALDIKPLVEEILQTIEPVASDKGISVISSIEALPMVEADPYRIRQVLYNLLVNAIRYTPTGGTITVIGTCRNGEITLTVRDTGEGLSQEELTAVFDRFYRGDKSRSRETGGTGLGLPIVEAVMQAHGGKVEARSKGKGQGSEFMVAFPVSIS